MEQQLACQGSHSQRQGSSHPAHDGKDGKDGLTPYIGDNGNWWIGDKDTGVQAEASVSTGNSPVIIIIGVVAGLALLGCIVLSVILYNVLKKKTDLI